MIFMAGNKRINFETIAALHVRDLFDGSPAAPARRLTVAKRKAVGRKVEAAPPVAVEPDVPEIAPPKHFTAIDCPCCKRRVGVADIEIIIDHYDIPPLQEAILRAVWRGKGMPVQTERIFSLMYADDPDGGPEPSKMYLAFKVGLCHLRKRLKGSGVQIETVGYRRGYRLVLAKG